MGQKIFLSYVREDLDRVDQIYNKLQAAGFEPWMDTRNLLPGEVWPAALRQAVQAADFFIACLSVHSVRKRGFVQREIRQALDLWQERLEEDIYLIPVRLDECDVPEHLTRFQWIDLFDLSGAAWKRLLYALSTGSIKHAPAEPLLPTSIRLASPSSVEPAALSMARRVLDILDQQAAGYTNLTIPVHLKIELENKRQEVAELEQRWRKG